MPTSTFFNLPEEKREKVVRAIKNEFSRVPFEKVSINKIVQSAGIPRGSFYQYFADRDDMLAFMLLDYQRQMVKTAKTSLRASNGDIFIALANILDATMQFARKEKGNNFSKNLFADIKVDSTFFFNIQKDGCEKNVLDELRPLIDLSPLDLRDEDDFTNMLGVLLTVCRDATAEVFLDISDCEKATRKYRRKLELLKRGFAKDKESISHA